MARNKRNTCAYKTLNKHKCTESSTQSLQCILHKSKVNATFNKEKIRLYEKYIPPIENREGAKKGVREHMDIHYTHTHTHTRVQI